MSLHTPDLTKFPPRSPRVPLGGKNGEYHYACPLDQQFLEFAGVDPEALKKELTKSDTEVLEWIQAHAKSKRTPAETAAWSAWQDQRAPDNPDGREYLNSLHKAGAPNRADIVSWFDVLDMD